MTLHTLDQIARLADVEVLDHLDRQVDVPIVAGAQAQGDLIVIPAPQASAATPVPPAGVAVIRGESGGHTHLLVADGPVFFDVADRSAQTVGALHVPAGATAYLIHPEHGATGIAPGGYILRRQREQADAIRMVAD